MVPANEMAAMLAVARGTLDVTATFQRATTTADGYGSQTTSWATLAMPKVNVIKPSATLLQQFAQIIAAQTTLVIRYDPVTGLQRGDRVIYGSDTYTVHAQLIAESYTFLNEAILVLIK